MSIKLTPISILSLATGFGLGLVLILTLLATRQPWLGLVLSFNEDNVIYVEQSYGPSASIPVGTRLIKIKSGETEMDITPVDLTIEPDGSIEFYKGYETFLKRQGQLHQIQSSKIITLTDDANREYTVYPEQSRPITTLPVKFWVQIIVGLFAWLISSAVFAFRLNLSSTHYLLLSGFSTLIFAPFSAVYSTRELAMPEQLFRWLSDGNFFGGSLFTACFIALLLHYPRRIGPKWLGPAVVGLYIIWFILQQIDVFDSMNFARRFLVMMGVFATFTLAGIQWYRTKKDPVARAALQWFLLSWLFGTTLFWLFILLPQMFGIDTAALQGYAYLLFLLVYGGLAFGILRYRLFDLGRWWGSIVIWSFTILILVLLDLAFLLILQLSSELSLGLALLLSGLLWLPLRSFVWNRFLNHSVISRDDLFERIVKIALTPQNVNLNKQWKKLLQDVFDPLDIHNTNNIIISTIEKNGLRLTVPSVETIPALNLDYAHAGRKLFTTADVSLTEELVSMLRHTLSSRNSYEKGMIEERQRISRDMHDNIGAQLLSALHNQNIDRKDTMIRETLTDLRDIINDASRPNLSFDEALADLRVETVERLSASEISHNWMIKSDDDTNIAPQIFHAIRSIIREAVSNVIKHSKAQRATIKIHHDKDKILLIIEDNGIGFNQSNISTGNGLANMQARIENIQGTLRISASKKGVILDILIPLNVKRSKT